MERITTYLCDKLCGTVDYEAFSGNIDAIEFTDELVKTSLWPEVSVPGCQTAAGKIIAQLLNVNNNRYVCPNGNLLIWEREEIVYEGEPVGLEDYITITIENSSHCHWIQSYILVFGADGNIFGRLFGLVNVGSGGQACPDDKDDVFSGGGKTEFHLIQNTVVPGERIVLGWVFWDDQYTEQIEVDARYLCTCCFTGGIVKSINGDYGDINITYTVEIQGIERTCVPSDFVEYEIGDWVFVLIPNSTCAESGRVTACKNGCEESENYTILPLRINEYGA